MELKTVSSLRQAEACDSLVAVLLEGESAAGGELAALGPAAATAIDAARSRSEIAGKLYQTSLLPLADGSPAPRVLVVGGGPAPLTTERARNVAGVAARCLKARGGRRIAFALRGEADAAMAQAVVEGYLIGLYEGGMHQREPAPASALEALTLIANDPGAAQAGAERGAIIGEATNEARRLTHEPSNFVTPRVLATRAEEMAGRFGLKCEILDRAAAERLGMGAYLAIAQGSDEPPFASVLHYRSERPTSTTLGLVGKGITFDSGGLSIKDGDSMILMKNDMVGAAVVLAAMQAIAQLKPAVNVIVVAPACENMVSGHAIKPGDVVCAMNGTTIEIVNTDSEGRLLLADGLCLAQQHGATHIMDIAGLSYSIIPALGRAASGLFGRPQPWVDHVKAAADGCGERLWQMPLYPDYRDQISSDVADISNIGVGAQMGHVALAGACMAATFVGQFAPEGLPWAHIDVCGTMWDSRGESAHPFMAAGPTGVGVRTLIAAALALGEQN